MEGWFDQFPGASEIQKTALAEKICALLESHMILGEGIVYPAILKVTGGRKSDSEAFGTTELFFYVSVRVLRDIIEHHSQHTVKPTLAVSGRN